MEKTYPRPSEEEIREIEKVLAVERNVHTVLEEKVIDVVTTWARVVWDKTGKCPGGDEIMEKKEKIMEILNFRPSPPGER